MKNCNVRPYTEEYMNSFGENICATKAQVDYWNLMRKGRSQILGLQKLVSELKKKATTSSTEFDEKVKIAEEVASKSTKATVEKIAALKQKHATEMKNLRSKHSEKLVQYAGLAKKLAAQEKIIKEKKAEILSLNANVFQLKKSNEEKEQEHAAAIGSLKAAAANVAKPEELKRLSAVIAKLEKSNSESKLAHENAIKKLNVDLSAKVAEVEKIQKKLKDDVNIIAKLRQQINQFNTQAAGRQEEFQRNATGEIKKHKKKVKDLESELAELQKKDQKEKANLIEQIQRLRKSIQSSDSQTKLEVENLLNDITVVIKGKEALAAVTAQPGAVSPDTVSQTKQQPKSSSKKKSGSSFLSTGRSVAGGFFSAGRTVASAVGGAMGLGRSVAGVAGSAMGLGRTSEVNSNPNTDFIKFQDDLKKMTYNEIREMCTKFKHIKDYDCKCNQKKENIISCMMKHYDKIKQTQAEDIPPQKPQQAPFQEELGGKPEKKQKCLYNREGKRDKGSFRKGECILTSDEPNKETLFAGYCVPAKTKDCKLKKGFGYEKVYKKTGQLLASAASSSGQTLQSDRRMLHRYLVPNTALQFGTFPENDPRLVSTRNASKRRRRSKSKKSRRRRRKSKRSRRRRSKSKRSRRRRSKSKRSRRRRSKSKRSRRRRSKSKKSRRRRSKKKKSRRRR